MSPTGTTIAVTPSTAYSTRTSAVGGDQGAAAGHRFQAGQAEPFTGAGAQEDSAAVVDVVHQLVLRGSVAIGDPVEGLGAVLQDAEHHDLQFGYPFLGPAERLETDLRPFISAGW